MTVSSPIRVRLPRDQNRSERLKTIFAVVVFAVAFTLLTLCSGSPIAASSIAPGIVGTVYHDRDQNGLISNGERLAGITVQLYRDNLDGQFDPNVDQLTRTVVSDASGMYRFEDIEGDARYFVHQVVSPAFEASVSPRIDPSVADRLIDSFEASQRVRVNTPNPLGTASDRVVGGGITIDSERQFTV